MDNNIVNRGAKPFHDYAVRIGFLQPRLEMSRVFMASLVQIGLNPNKPHSLSKANVKVLKKLVIRLHRHTVHSGRMVEVQSAFDGRPSPRCSGRKRAA